MLAVGFFDHHKGTAGGHMSERTGLFETLKGVGFLAVAWVAASVSVATAAPSSYAPHGTVTVDGMTVPDIGPMPTQVPTPPTNLSYAQKVELGRQL